MGMNPIVLDGDLLREVTSEDLGFSPEDRLKDAYRKAKLCKYLTNQGGDVICATISLFKDIHDYNRANIDNYWEVLIEADIELLKRRKPSIYSGEMHDIWGRDIEPQWPEQPHLRLSAEESIQNNITLVLNSIFPR